MSAALDQSRGIVRRWWQLASGYAPEAEERAMMDLARRLKPDAFRVLSNGRFLSETPARFEAIKLAAIAEQVFEERQEAARKLTEVRRALAVTITPPNAPERPAWPAKPRNAFIAWLFNP